MAGPKRKARPNRGHPLAPLAELIKEHASRWLEVQPDAIGVRNALFDLERADLIKVRRDQVLRDGQSFYPPFYIGYGADEEVSRGLAEYFGLPTEPVTRCPFEEKP